MSYLSRKRLQYNGNIKSFPMRWIYFTLCICSFFIEACKSIDHTGIGHGTVILTYVSQDSIVMAADSRFTVTYATGDQQFRKICKIHQNGNIVYAFAGIYELMDQSGKILYDASVIMDKCIKDKKLMKPAYDYFVDTMKNSVIPSQLKNLSALAKEKIINNGGLFLGISMVCFYNGQPYYQFGKCTVNNILSHDPSIQFDKSILKQLSMIHKSGVYDHISKYIENHSEEMADDKRLYETMSKFIRIEAREHRSDVDSAINIICLKPNGITWVIKNQICK